MNVFLDYVYEGKIQPLINLFETQKCPHTYVGNGKQCCISNEKIKTRHHVIHT